MASTHFETGVVITSDWLNYVDDAVYNPTSSVIPATAIVNTPTGTIVATNVQAAIDELDAEKQPLDADLTAIAALTTTAYGRALLEVASEAALKALINLEAGVDYIANVAPGTSGNVLTSNGTIWTSSASTVLFGTTWTSVTRTSGTTYYTTDKYVMLILAIEPYATSTYGSLAVAINGGAAIPIAGASYSTTAVKTAGSIIIPPNSSYVPTNNIGGTMVAYELL